MIKKVLIFPFICLASIITTSCSKDDTVTPIEHIYLRVDSVNATSVFLYWTPYTLDKFQDYQVHYSKKEGFTPSSGTLYKTFTDRYTTRTTVDSLVTNQPYYFIVRLVKSDATTDDTNEEPAIPK